VQDPDAGVKQVERLVRKANDTVAAIAATQAQLTKTLDVYNALLSDSATDRKDLYKKLQKEMESTEKKRADIAVKRSAMDAEADVVFNGWQQSTAQIADGNLRTRSEKRLAETKANYAKIAETGAKAAQHYEPVMKTLGDHVAYLGHDLNTSAVASLKPDAAKLNAQAEDLGKRIDETMATANQMIATLQP
jgi:hypothetical protein